MSTPPPPPQRLSAPPLGPEQERTWAVVAHLLPLVVTFLGPLAVWLALRGRGPFVEHHALESLNFQLTVLGATMVAVVLTFASAGLLAVLPFGVLVVGVVLHVLAAVAASRGEWYRYPLSVRLVR